MLTRSFLLLIGLGTPLPPPPGAHADTFKGSGLSTENSPGAATGPDDGSMLSGGGDDGSMITWSLLMLILIAVDAPSKYPRQFLTCRSILDALCAR